MGRRATISANRHGVATCPHSTDRHRLLLMPHSARTKSKRSSHPDGRGDCGIDGASASPRRLSADPHTPRRRPRTHSDRLHRHAERWNTPCRARAEPPDGRDRHRRYVSVRSRSGAAGRGVRWPREWHSACCRVRRRGFMIWACACRDRGFGRECHVPGRSRSGRVHR